MTTQKTYQSPMQAVDPAAAAAANRLLAQKSAPFLHAKYPHSISAPKRRRRRRHRCKSNFRTNKRREWALILTCVRARDLILRSSSSVLFSGRNFSFDKKNFLVFHSHFVLISPLALLASPPSSSFQPTFDAAHRRFLYPATQIS